MVRSDIHFGFVAILLFVLSPFNSAGACEATGVHLDAGALKKSLNKGQFATKGEFETTDQFAARTKQFFAMANVPLDGSPFTLTFKMPQNAVLYDADKGKLTLWSYQSIPNQFDFRATLSGQLSHLSGFAFEEVGHTNGTYVAQNEFGATTTVTSGSLTNYALVWDSNTMIARPGTLELEMEPGRAKELEPQMMVTVEAKALPPYLVKNTDFSKATFDDPTDLAVNVFGLYVQPICVVVHSVGQTLFTWEPFTGGQ